MQDKEHIPELEQEFLRQVERNKALIYKVCHTFAQQGDDRNDLFQDIVAQLWRAFPSYRGDAKWTTWAYRIALNVAITQRRKRRPNTEEIDEHIEKRWADTATDSGKDERLDLLHRAIMHLNEGEKALILLYLDDVPHTEIAEIIGITINNVSVKLNRIKVKLKHWIEYEQQYA